MLRHKTLIKHGTDDSFDVELNALLSAGWVIVSQHIDHGRLCVCLSKTTLT